MAQIMTAPERTEQMTTREVRGCLSSVSGEPSGGGPPSPHTVSSDSPGRSKRTSPPLEPSSVRVATGTLSRPPSSVWIEQYWCGKVECSNLSESSGTNYQ